MAKVRRIRRNRASGNVDDKGWEVEWMQKIIPHCTGLGLPPFTTAVWFG